MSTMRKLKHHEQKLLKKVDFYSWKAQKDHRQSKIIHRFYLQKRQDYQSYNKICGLVTSLIVKIKQLPTDDPFRIKATQQLLQRLYNMGIINNRQNIQQCQKISVSGFCKRRLSVILNKNKFAQTMKQAVSFIQQGHVRVGTNVVTDPSMLITRQMEDHVGWVDSSQIKKKILKYQDKFDDYDMMN